MKCQYPNCLTAALWVPVIKIPTIRSVGQIKPELSPLVAQPDMLRVAGLDRDTMIRQYEDRVDDYKRNENRTIVDGRPTILTGQPICQAHRDNYNLMDWITEPEWQHLRDAARERGFVLQEGVMITVEFRPVGWAPKKRLEIVR